jgi:hypothetical protein
VVLDNLAAPRAQVLDRWLLRHPRFHLHFHTDLRVLAQPRVTFPRRAHREGLAAQIPPASSNCERQSSRTSKRTTKRASPSSGPPADEILDKMQRFPYSTGARAVTGPFQTVLIQGTRGDPGVRLPRPQRTKVLCLRDDLVPRQQQATTTDLMSHHPDRIALGIVCEPWSRVSWNLCYTCGSTPGCS